MDKAEEYEFNVLRTRYNGLLSKLEKRDARITELEIESSDRKTAIDRMSAELSRIKRREKKIANT